MTAPGTGDGEVGGNVGDAGGGGAPPDPRAGWVAGAGGVRLRTLTWLPPGGAERASGRLLVVHGLGEHAGRYDELARHLASEGIATVAWDQRGHGASGGKRGVVGSFEELLDDLESVWAAAGRDGAGGPDVLLGHSLGGLVVLRHLQTRRPALDGAILSAPWLGTAVRVPAWKRLAAWALRRIAPDLSLSAGVDPELLTGDPAKRREYEEDPLVHDRISAGLHHAVLEAQERALAEQPDPELPLLFLVPLGDGLVDSRVTLRYAEALGGSAKRPGAGVNGSRGAVEVEALEGARHEPLNDLGREGVFRRVTAWIRARSSPGA